MAGFARPADLADALALLTEHPDATVVAGSTDWGVEANLRGRRASYLVAVDRLPELRGLSTDGVVEIGAALTLSEVEAMLGDTVPLLARVWPLFASRLIRNGATIGGNLVTASPIGDLALLLLALDATLVLASGDGDREVPLAEFFTGYRETLLRPAELVRAVRVPMPLAEHAPSARSRSVATTTSPASRSPSPSTSSTTPWSAPGSASAGSPPPRSGDAPRRRCSRAGRGPGERRGRGGGAGDRRHADRRPARQRGVPLRDARQRPARLVGRVMTTTPTTFFSSAALPGRRLGDAGWRRTALPHESAAQHVTGHALFTDDLVHRTPHVLHAHPVCSPHAHARVTRLDPTPALAVDGVVRVLTVDDVPGVNDAGVKHDEPLFPDEVMFVGHAVCWVLAETLEAARLGALAVEVDYEPLPAIVALTEAIDAESFQGGHPIVARGDVEQGLAAAAHVFSGVTEMAGQEHFYLETHASLALVDESGQVFMQSSTQHPTETQEIVAHVLGRESHAVTVQCLRMGGGFGGKEMQPHGFAAIAALGATLTGRPVRLRLNRTHDMTMTGKRHGFHAQWRVGFDDDGRLVALEATLTCDGGWSLDLSEPVLARALCHVDNAYWIPHVLLHGRVARTHKTSRTAFRGFGGPRGCS